MPGAARYPGATQFVPDSRSLPTLSRAAQDCRGCDLYARASQVAFGEGDGAARLMLVGEQPGDVEDRQGHPFVGPAGGLLDRALAEAGLADLPTFTTNAVKHFKWKQSRGAKRRIHDKPTAAESAACRPWPPEKGDFTDDASGPVAAFATIHPSAVLRAPDDERRAAYAGFVHDLEIVAGALAES